MQTANWLSNVRLSLGSFDDWANLIVSFCFVFLDMTIARYGFIAPIIRTKTTDDGTIVWIYAIAMCKEIVNEFE